MQFSLEAWLLFITFISVAIALDLGLLNKKGGGKPSFTQAASLTLVWISLAFIFALGLKLYTNDSIAVEFVTGYIVELSLSMDNIFVFMLIFRYFKVPLEHQRRVLFWGIMGAIVMRFIMIIAGVYLVHQFEWIFYVFGAFLIFSAYKLLASTDGQIESSTHESAVVTWLKGAFKITPDFHGDLFVVKHNGKLMFTPLLLVLVLVEQTDLLFALDSIPAILAITQDSFVVFSSNIFAILGLRSLYFLLIKVIDKFIYLQHALAVILGYIGVKMILMAIGIKISTILSLGVIFGSLGVAIVASIRKAKML